MVIIFSYGKGLYLGNLTSLSPKYKFKDFIQDWFSFFFRNVVIVLLKCRLSTLERTIIFLEDTNRLKRCVDQGFPIK
jgi:hypothetical protein